MPPRVYPFWMVSLRCPLNLSESAQGCIYLNMRITSITTVKQVEPEAHIFNCDTSALIASESFLSMRDALTSREPIPDVSIRVHILIYQEKNASTKLL